MLRYLASKGAVKENPFDALTMQLLNRNPRLRPLLYHPVTAGHSLSKPQGRKFKRDAPIPDVERVGLLVRT
jgi:hypothetical protein